MFEELACSVLNEFDANTDDQENEILLLNKWHMVNMDCLQLAKKANCLKFMSAPTVQNLITNVWHNQVVPFTWKTSLNVKISLKYFPKFYF